MVDIDRDNDRDSILDRSKNIMGYETIVITVFVALWIYGQF